MGTQIVRLSARLLLVRAKRPSGGTLRIAGWLGRSTNSRTRPANPTRAWIVFIGKDGEGILIRSFRSLFYRRVLHELFELCADNGVSEARALHRQRCWLCLGDDFMPEPTAFALQRVALKAGPIPHDIARRAGIPIKYLVGSGS